MKSSEQYVCRYNCCSHLMFGNVDYWNSTFTSHLQQLWPQYASFLFRTFSLNFLPPSFFTKNYTTISLILKLNTKLIIKQARKQIKRAATWETILCNGTTSTEFDWLFETRDFSELLRILGYPRWYVANTVILFPFLCIVDSMKSFQFRGPLCSLESINSAVWVIGPTTACPLVSFRAWGRNWFSFRDSPLAFRSIPFPQDSGSLSLPLLRSGQFSWLRFVSGVFPQL